ncbi:MAG: hypothetical protein QM793_07220 [Muricomes sp.]
MINSSLNQLNEEFKMHNGRDIGKKDLIQPQFFDFDEGGIINFHTSFDSGTFYRIPRFSQGSNYWVMTDFREYGDYNCGPTAITNAVWYFGWDLFGYHRAVSNNCLFTIKYLWGHFVTCIGRVNSTGGARYLVVMDGWERSGRLVRDNYYFLVRGKKIWIRE